ncbi:TIM barrel protein [Candidatus Pacearchaeota archaeon]|nr:TIM barrel protein [Candidatus Pacearchaeota archaeon]
MSLQKYFIELLGENVVNKNTSPKLTKKIAQKLVERIKIIKLYAHWYAFTLNFQKGDFDTFNLLNFAYENGLKGINIHIDSGDKKSLRKKSKKSLEDIRLHAEKLKLGINLEMSSTSKEEVDSVVKIAKILYVKNIRVYIRYGGHVSKIKKNAINDLKYIQKIAKQEKLFFVVEPHEVLKSNELVQIIKEVNSPKIRLLFDFGNMVNANENPMDALTVMSPYISQVHMKGVKKVKIKEGFKQIGVPEGEGDLPQMRMLFTLLLLGEFEPQVKFYALEQEVGYKSPPFRFDNDNKDPIIPKREPSVTYLDKNKSTEENLLLESKNACKQVQYVKSLLKQMETMSKLIIKK